MKDLLYFENLWSELRRDRVDNESYWDERAAFFNNIKNSDKQEENQQTLIAKLAKRGIIHKDASVLDIGCGVGRYALAFSPKVREVYGTDISSKALAYAKVNLELAGCKNISLVKGDWNDISLQELNWENKFDFVFASMCPGITSKETLEKMTKASSSYCLLSSFAMRKDSIRSKLSKLCGIQGFDNDNRTRNSVYCIFNILWLLGYYPEITIQENNWQHLFTTKEAATQYKNMLAAPGKLLPEQLARIDKYIIDCSIDGYITEYVTTKIAWIGWNAKK